jgi:hypothetical protein
MFPLASPAGTLGIPGSANFSGPAARVGVWGLATSLFSGDLRTLFRSMHPNQNTVFGAAPNGTATVAAIQAYSTDNLGYNGSGYRYGDLRTTPGFVQITSAALGPGGNNAISPGPPSPWPLRFFVNGKSHVVDINGGWSFNNGQTILDFNGFLTLTGSFRAPQIGLNVTPNANTVQIGQGGVLQFDRPDGANSFQNYYKNNDLLLTWNFNAGATIMSLDNAGNLAIAGTFNAAGGVTGLPTPAMVRIAQVVCAGSQTTVDFSGIPAGYTNLMVVWQGRSTSAAVGDNKMKLMINGDTISGHYQAGQYGSHASTINTAGTTAATTAGADIGDMPGTTSVAVASGTGTLLIPGYSGTTFVKQVLSDSVEFYINNTTGLPRVVRAFQWSVASAINQLTFSLVAGNFLDGSTFTVYGLA